MEDAEIVRTEQLEIEGGTIPISLWRESAGGGESWGIEVDGVEWVAGVPSRMHAVVLFEMMRDHLTDYMRYVAV